MPALSYRQVKDIYDALHDSGAVTQSMSQWAQGMNALTDSELYSEGLHENWLRNLNVNINRGLEWTGLPEAAGNLGASIGGLFGMEDVGRAAGESIPRMGLDVASFFIPGLGQANAWSRLAPAMAMSGIGAYGDTGSPAAGVTSAALMGVLPGVTNKAEQWALRKLGAERLSGSVIDELGYVTKSGFGKTTGALPKGAVFDPLTSTTKALDMYLPENLAQGAAAYGAGQLAGVGLMGGSELLQQALDPNAEMVNPFTRPDFWLSLGIQQLPFAFLHGAKKLTGPSYDTNIANAYRALAQGHDVEMNQRYRAKVEEDLKRQGLIGTAKPLTPRAQHMEDLLRGTEPTDDQRTEAAARLSKIDELNKLLSVEGDAVRKADIEKQLVAEQDGLENAVRSGEIPFSALVVPAGIETDATGEITHVTEPGVSGVGNKMKGGKVFAWVDQPDGTRKYIAFPRTRLSGEHEVGQKAFKIPTKPRFIEQNPEQNPVFLAQVAAEKARVEAKAAQDALQAEAPLRGEVTGTQQEIANRALELVGADALKARAKSLLPKNEKGEEVSTAETRANAMRAAERQIVAEHEANSPVAQALRQEEAALRELERVKHEERVKKIQEVAELVNKVTDKVPEYVEIAERIEDLLAELGMPSMFKKGAARSGPLAGVTAHNLGLVLHKGRPFFKAKLQEIKLIEQTIAKQEAEDSATKTMLRLDAQQGDALQKLVSESPTQTQGQQDVAESVKEATVQEPVAAKADVEDAYHIDPQIIGDTTDPVTMLLRNEHAIKAIQANETAKVLFDKWNKSVGGEVSWSEEMQRIFSLFGSLYNEGGKFDAKKFESELPYELTVGAGDLSTFASRPHVVDMLKTIKTAFEQPGKALPTIIRAGGGNFSAGGDFIWSVNPDVVPPQMSKGTPDEAWFKKNAGLGADKTVPPVEMTIMKALYPEAFLTKDGRAVVDMEKLRAAMSDPERQPVVTEVFTPEGKVSEAKKELNQMTHEWWDTLSTTQRQQLQRFRQMFGRPDVTDMSAVKDTLVEDFGPLGEQAYKYFDLENQVRNEPPATESRAQWMFLSSAEHGVGNPHGYFEMAVAVPTKGDAFDQQLGSARERREDGGVLFSGQHSPFPPNTLIHLRGYFAEHPTEGRVMVLDEVQSDWGAEVRRAKEQGKEFFGNPPVSHPLLPIAHVLGLKAALAKIVKESPGTKVVIVSPETGAMTQGHDKVARSVWREGQDIVIDRGEGLGQQRTRWDNSDEYAQAVKQIYSSFDSIPEGKEKAALMQPPQMGGHITNNAPTYYVIRDAEGKTLKGKVFRTEKEAREAATEGQTVAPQTGTLVSALRSLTGDEGREVVMPGVHKQAQRAYTDTDLQRDLAELSRQRESGEITGSEWLTRQRELSDQYEQRGGPPKVTVGSPVFRDPSGNPETRVTGTVFDTTKSTENFLRNEGFTLSRPSYAKWKPTPEQLDRVQSRKLNGTGHDLAQVVASMTEADSADTAWAAYLLRFFPEALKRVTARFNPNGSTVVQPFPHEYRSEIQFSPWVTGESDASFARFALEELNHAVSALALDDPKNAPTRSALEALRQRVIDGLSKEERKVHEKLQKLPPGTVIRAGDIHPDQRIEDLVYSLRDVHEFVGNGMTTHPLRERLLLMEKKQGWFSKFVQNVKSLFGIKPTDTAYDEFLYHTGQIMDAQEAVAKSMNYLEEHFAQRGYDGELATRTAQLTRQFMNRHGVGKADTTALFLDLSKPRVGTVTPEYEAAKREFNSVFTDPQKEVERRNLAMTFEDEKPGRAVGEWFLNQLETPTQIHFFQAFPPEVQRFITAQATRMRDILEGVNALSKNGGAPVTDILDPKSLQRTSKEMLEALRPFAQQEVIRQKGIADMRAFNSFAPENMLAVMGQQHHAKIPKDASPDALVDKAPGWLRTKFLQLGQWMQESQLVKELFYRIESSDVTARKVATRVHHTVWGYDPANPAKYNSDIAKSWQKWIKVERNKDTVDAILRVNNVMGKDKVKLLDLNHPAMVAELQGVPEDVKVKAQQLVRQISLGNKMLQEHNLLRMNENGVLQGAKMVLLGSSGNPNLRAEDALKASKLVLDGVLALRENPSNVMAGQRLTEARAMVEPKVYETLLATQMKLADVIRGAKDHFANNPGWVSAQRKGKYLYTGDRDGQPVLLSADSDKEMRWWATKHGVKNLKLKGENPKGDYVGINWSQEFIDKAKEYDEHLYREQAALGASAEQLQSLRDYAVGAQILKDAMVSYDVGDTSTKTKGRTLSRGGDIVPWLDNFNAYSEGTASYWNKRNLRDMVETTLLAPEYRAAPETSEKLRAWLRGYLQPDPDGMRTFQKAVTGFTLGSNVGFLIANAFQPFLRGIPEIMAHGIPFWKAFRAVTSSLKDWARHDDLSKKLKGDDQWAMQQLDENLVIDRSLFDEHEMAQNNDRTNIARALAANKPQTLAQHAASVGGGYFNVAMAFARQGERANATATTLGAFRALQRQFPEKGREWALRTARDIHIAVNDPGGRLNRAIGLYDNAGPASRSAAMMAGALQTYTFGTMTQLIRNFQKGWRGSSLTPAEKFAARKSFLTQLGLQFAVAGMLGMPFVSGIMALINQAAPDLEINKNVRQLMQQFFAEDGKDGHPLTDMMMSGLPSQLGWDMQSRLASGNILPGVSDRDGFSLEQLAGVPVSVVGQMAGGAKALVGGEASGLMAFVPPGIRKQIELVTGQAGKDYRGRPVVDDMTPGEKVGMAVGLRPQRLREFNDAQRMEKQAEEQSNKRTARQREKWAAQVVKGEFGSVIGELKAQLQENPKMDVAGEVRQIAKYAEDQVFPRDLRREAKGDARSALLSSWNLSPSQPTEEQRLQFRTKIEQQFGVRSNVGPALATARQLDELRKAHPEKTRSELREMLGRMRPQVALPE